MGKSKGKDSTLHTMGARVNYTRNKSWNTRSNKIRQVRTPGGRLAAQYVTKKAKGPGNGLRTSSVRLGGLARLRPTDYKQPLNIQEESLELMEVFTPIPNSRTASAEHSCPR